MARMVCSRSANPVNVAGVGLRGGWRNIASVVIRAQFSQNDVVTR
jgi:hypothetical protein